MNKPHLAPEWITALCTLIVAVTGILALVYASTQIREARQEAQVHHLLSLDKDYRAEPMLSYRRAYAQKRLSGVADPDEGYRLLDFYESVALLVNRGYLQDTDVWELFGRDILYVYADERDNLEQDQKDDPTDYSSVTKLVTKLEAIDQAQHGTTSKPSKDDLRSFWQDEAGQTGRNKGGVK